MTKDEAQNALDQFTLVAGGEPGTEDYDTGRIVEYDGSDKAVVAWDTGVRTETPISDLRVAS